MKRMQRSTFLTTAAGMAAALTAAAPAPAQNLTPAPSPAPGAPAPAATLPPALPNAGKRAGRTALVLSGGGARGAYEAGIICALADKSGLKDGQPLPYDFVCGTSIGGMNAYMTATAQYTRMKTLWETVAQYGVANLKSPYNKIKDPRAGNIAKARAAIALGKGAFTDVAGLLDPSGVWKLLDIVAQTSDPVHIPLYIAATNITRVQGEIFLRRANTPEGLVKQAINDQILTNYKRTPIRDMTDEYLHKALFGSAAMPVAFDPIMIPPAWGGPPEAYVDGGVTHNVPIGVARRCCENLNVILVDPPQRQYAFPIRNVIEIALGSFATMQAQLFETQVRLAYAESAVAGLVARTTSSSADAADDIPLQVGYLRPAAELPGGAMNFSDGPSLKKSFDVGYEDGTKGWQTFVPHGLTN
jgi:predicted acylesterase/phospholipase RssA